ncbi:MAG: tetratricopeptide repeat protein [Candidatus Omnitrophota bacterium]
MKRRPKVTRQFFVIILFIFFWIGLVNSAETNLPERIAAYYKKGNAYIEQGKYKEAQEEFQKAITLWKQKDMDSIKAISPPAELTGQPPVKENETQLFKETLGPVSKEIDELLKSEEQKVSIDYKDVPLSSILQSFAFTYNLNLVYAPDIKGKVTVSLKNVTLEEALEAVLGCCGYSSYRKGNLIYIYPSIGLEESSLITLPIPLKYLTASEAQALVTKSLSPKGDVRLNEVTNSIVVRDFAPVLDKIAILLEEIDAPPRQVLIEAKIVDISSQDLENIGLTYSATYSAPGGLFGHSHNSYEGNDEVSGTFTTSGPSSSLTGGQFKLDTFIMKNWDATATIDALVQDQKAHILASPSIATLNGKEAKIVIGEKVPYKEKTQTTTGTTETTKFIDVGTSLRVTPQISPDGYITMVVHPEVSSVSALLDAGPRITTREADVVVRVKDGETFVIGGLIKNEDARVRSRIPILGHLPVLGLLFGNKSHDLKQTELAVFVTPRIIHDSGGIKQVKVPKREEVSVNIARVGERILVNKLFEKCLYLETNQGIESRRKDKTSRLSEAVDLYQNIATQFPESDKADESLYRGGKIYYWFFHDQIAAKQMFQALVDNYPRSKYYSNSRFILRGLRNVPLSAGLSNSAKK